MFFGAKRKPDDLLLANPLRTETCKTPDKKQSKLRVNAKTSALGVPHHSNTNILLYVIQILTHPQNYIALHSLHMARATITYLNHTTKQLWDRSLAQGTFWDRLPRLRAIALPIFIMYARNVLLYTSESQSRDQDLLHSVLVSTCLDGIHKAQYTESYRCFSHSRLHIE